MPPTYVDIVHSKDYYFASVNESISNFTRFTVRNTSSGVYNSLYNVDILPADNSHIVIPLMSFVFGFPVLVMTVLCIIQERNKWMYERQAALRLQQARLSTTSTLYTGLNPARSMLHIKDSINTVVYATSEQALRNGYNQKNREETVTMDSLNHKQQQRMSTKLSDETLEEIDELETDSSKNICSTSTDKTTFSGIDA